MSSLSPVTSAGRECALHSSAAAAAWRSAHHTLMVSWPLPSWTLDESSMLLQHHALVQANIREYFPSAAADVVTKCGVSTDNAEADRQ